VGYGNNKGIVPLACEEIFRRIEDRIKNPENNIQHQVTLGMVEIYNEAIQDLLVSTNERPKGGLDVQDHPTLGIRVVGQTEYPVTSYDEI